MLKELKEAGINAGLRSSNIRVVDPALITGGPSRPNKTRNVMLSILVGLIGGIGLALLREYLDNTVKTPDDIETLARLPSLAVVPALSNSNGKRNGRFAKLLKAPVIAGKEGRAELMSHNMPQSQMSEAFRALRTSLLLSQADHPPQVILMTSALPREGKTTAAVNLAGTLAHVPRGVSARAQSCGSQGSFNAASRSCGRGNMPHAGCGADGRGRQFT